MEDRIQGFSLEQKERIDQYLPAYFAAELGKWMGRHADKSETHRLVKYPDDTIETASGVTFRQRYVLMPNENVEQGITLLPFEVEAELFPHTTLAVTIAHTGGG